MDLAGSIETPGNTEGILKFRSINIKFSRGGKREIKMMMDVSSCLKLYNFFYDSQIFFNGKRKKNSKFQIKGYFTRRSVI